MVIVLKKELSKTNNTNDLEDMDKYRQILIRGLHQLSIKFPDIAVSIIPSKYHTNSFVFCSRYIRQAL